MNNQNTFYIKKLFFLVIGLLSASTSFGYFMEVFQISDNQTVTLLTGLTGVIITDGSAFCWLSVYLHSTTNSHGRTFSIFGMIIGLVGSIICSLSWILSTTQIVILPEQSHVWSVLAMSAVVAVHFVLVFMSAVMGQEKSEVFEVYPKAVAAD